MSWIKQEVFAMWNVDTCTNVINFFNLNKIYIFIPVWLNFYFILYSCHRMCLLVYLHTHLYGFICDTIWVIYTPEKKISFINCNVPFCGAHNKGNHFICCALIFWTAFVIYKCVLVLQVKGINLTMNFTPKHLGVLLFYCLSI